MLFLPNAALPPKHSTSGNTPPPPPVCGSTNAGALYTNTGTSPATVYTCSYYNLAWQWVVNPSYGGLVSYPTVPTTCSGALPVFLAGWPNTQMYMCVSGVPLLIGGTGNAIGSFTYAGTSAPSATCSALVNNGFIATNSTPQAYQCSNATGIYQWNPLGGSGGIWCPLTGCTFTGPVTVDSTLNIGAPITPPEFSMEPLSTIPASWTLDVTTPGTALASLMSGGVVYPPPGTGTISAVLASNTKIVLSPGTYYDNLVLNNLQSVWI